MTYENITDVETKAKKVKAEAEGEAKKISSKIKDKADDLLDKTK